MAKFVSFIVASTVMLCAGVTAAAPLSDGRVDWSGEGRFRAKLDVPIRKARCQVSSEPTASPQGFKLTGKCAAPSGSATIYLNVERRGGGGVAGAMASSVIDGTIQLIGVERPDGIALVSREPLQIDDRDMQFQIELKWPTAGEMTLNEWLTPLDGDTTTQIVWITLSE